MIEHEYKLEQDKQRSKSPVKLPTEDEHLGFNKFKDLHVSVPSHKQDKKNFSDELEKKVFDLYFKHEHCPNYVKDYTKIIKKPFCSNFDSSDFYNEHSLCRD
jgi:hypothetical protein